MDMVKMDVLDDNNARNVALFMKEDPDLQIMLAVCCPEQADRERLAERQADSRSLRMDSDGWQQGVLVVTVVGWCAVCNNDCEKPQSACVPGGGVCRASMAGWRWTRGRWTAEGTVVLSPTHHQHTHTRPSTAHASIHALAATVRCGTVRYSGTASHRRARRTDTADTRERRGQEASSPRYCSRAEHPSSSRSDVASQRAQARSRSLLRPACLPGLAVKAKQSKEQGNKERSWIVISRDTTQAQEWYSHKLKTPSMEPGSRVELPPRGECPGWMHACGLMRGRQTEGK
jgi:hypothetical protein